MKITEIISKNLFLEILPNWLTAIGTVGAVIVSLWLSLNSVRIRYRASANFMKNTINDDEHLLIRIINTGQKPFTVESLFWILKRRFKKQIYYQNPDINLFTQKIPKRLNEGEEVNIFLDSGILKDNIVKKFVPNHSIQLLFTTSYGHSCRINIAKSSIEKLYSYTKTRTA